MTLQEPWQQMLSYAKLISSHRFSPSLDLRFDKAILPN